MSKKIAIIGTAWPFRGGGIASFNERLAKAFQDQGHEVVIYNFSLQYPSFLFPGKTQYSNDPAPKDLNIQICINSINPFNWITVGNNIKNSKPDLVVVRYWIPLMGPCLGTILRIIKKNKYSKLICIADNIIPHEKRKGDQLFTSYFVKPMDGFITMSSKVMTDLKSFTQTHAIQTVHPLYDNFGDPLSKEEARTRLGLNLREPLMLFFGFIRKYKGLDLLLEAMYLLKNEQKTNPEWRIPKLMIAGEYYGDEDFYIKLMEKYQIEDLLILKTDFVPDDAVKYYLSAADFVIQPYRNATQSGVTPLAYHFEKPMLVTNVGGLSDMVPDGVSGIVTQPDAASIANGIKRLYQLGEDYFIPRLREEKKKYSWQKLTDAIFDIAFLKH